MTEDKTAGWHHRSDGHEFEHIIIGGGSGNPLQYFARKIPWTEEPGELQSMGSQKSGTQLSNWALSILQSW